MADILIEVIREYRFVWEQKTYQVGVSIGIVPITAESSSRTQLMHDADQACYAAKDLGRGRACVYSGSDSELGQRIGEKLQRKDIDDAIAGENFVLLYQPIVALDPERTRLHTRGEILLRMVDDTGKIIAPGAFLPSATRFGLMPQIDRWVIERVLTGYPHVFMQNPELVLGLNLSAPSLNDESLADFILGCFDHSVVKPEQICFEISEATLSHNFADASRLIERLRGQGCSVALDDFGTGLASFSALKTLEVDFVKIDGNLVRDINRDQVDRAMVESIHAMAGLLKIRTIAENVDDENLVASLREIGLDYAQGYYLGELVEFEQLGVDIRLHDGSVVQVN